VLIHFKQIESSIAEVSNHHECQLEKRKNEEIRGESPLIDARTLKNIRQAEKQKGEGGCTYTEIKVAGFRGIDREITAAEKG
jgi:hypothetical protein